VSFSKDILRIFTNNGSKTCAKAGCHAGGRSAGGLNLTASQAYQNIVSVSSSTQPSLKRVLPGDAGNSYLYQMVASGRMPLSGGSLTSADIDLIRQWINAGALNS
jgi:hypothetical protein